MSPILTLQRRAQEIGRIRMGVQKRAQNGKIHPAKLDAFRFTTASQHAAEAIAAHLGGQARRWDDAPAGEQWEVLTPAKEIPVAVPPGDAVISQWFEMWSAGGCVRRCDGETEQNSGQKCSTLCPQDPARRDAMAKNGQACKMTTRLSVIIPDLPGIGVWRLESHGYYAAVELAGAAELLGAARGRGMVVPAILRVEQRQRRFFAGGEQVTRNYPVPVLEILSTLREMTELAASGARSMELPPAPQRAIGSGPSRAVASAQRPAQAQQQPRERQRPAPAAQQAPGPAQRPAEQAQLAPAPDPSTLPGSAQACADAARAVTRRADLLPIGRHARERGWMDTMVAGADDVHEELQSLLFSIDSELYHAEQEAQGRTDDVPPPTEPPAEVDGWDPR